MGIRRSHASFFAVIALGALALAVGVPLATGDKGGKEITLRIGEAVHFPTGKVTRLAAEGDMAFKYMPPQGPHGWRYNPMTGQIEYQAQVATTENYPLLEAARAGAFKTPPDLARLTVGDVDGWTGDEYDVGPGRFLLVRGATSGKHYLVRIRALATPTKDPQSWRITFTYEPVELGLGAAGTAGQNLPLRGTLLYRERLVTQKIIELDLATGKTVERGDGIAVSRDRKGTTAVLDNAGRLVLADDTGKPLATLPAPPFAPKSFGVGGPQEVVLSPDGQRIAVVGDRSRPHTTGGITVQGIPTPTTVVIDRAGRELASFHGTRSPAWTPDGRLVVAGILQPGLAISDRELRGLNPIPGIPEMSNLADPAVSPDGKSLAFSGNGRVWLAGVDGSGLRQLTSSGLPEITPAWSPDGAHIALQQLDRPRSNDAYRIVVVRLSDGKTVTVTDDRGQAREPAGRMVWR